MTEYICDCGKNFGNSKSHFIRHSNKKFPCKKIMNQEFASWKDGAIRQYMNRL
jgi:hypothetical protein